MKKNREKTIFLADTNDASEYLMKEVLRGTEYQYHRFFGASDALATIQSIKPQLIISGYKLNDCNGIEFLNMLLESCTQLKLGEIPFIFLTSKEDQVKNSVHNSDKGLWGWYTFPFGAHELREIIDNLFHYQDVLFSNEELRQEVRRSEYRYRDLLENANDFIFTLDETGHFLNLNNRFTSLTGFNKDEWLGKPFLALVEQSDSENAGHQFHRTQQGRARVFESKIKSRTENSPTISFGISPILERGQIVGAMGIGRDITDTKQMENEIIELKNFNESIIQSMEAGLMTLDLKDCITFINLGAEKTLGWSSKELITKPLDQVLRSEEAQIILKKPESKRDLSFSRETEITIKGGQKIFIGFTAMDRFDNTGQKVGTIISFRDISLLKQMQAEVIRMDRLVSLGVLASGIAHEIKNPLAGIKTMAQACEEEFEEGDDRTEYLVRIIRQVDRLDDLLKTFFKYARPSPPDRKRHHLGEILDEVMNLVEKKMNDFRVQFILDLAEDLPEILVDSQQLQQVLLNLILNAIDAMPDGGELRISADRIKGKQKSTLERAIEKSNKYVEINIEDTGEGIPADKLETIFDPFVTTKSNGLGLGLSIVYRIVREHDGEIHVSSKHGAGTRFILTIPTGENV